jgi:hypothetical protein
VKSGQEEIRKHSPERGKRVDPGVVRDGGDRRGSTRLVTDKGGSLHPEKSHPHGDWVEGGADEDPDQEPGDQYMSYLVLGPGNSWGGLGLGP